MSPGDVHAGRACWPFRDRVVLVIVGDVAGRAPAPVRLPEFLQLSEAVAEGLAGLIVRRKQMVIGATP